MVSFEMETNEVISEVIEELFDRVWYEENLVLKYKIENVLETVKPKIWKGTLKSAYKVRKKYGEENLGPYDDFDCGMLIGKLSALRWIFDEDWDMLDTQSWL